MFITTIRVRVRVCVSVILAGSRKNILYSDVSFFFHFHFF